MVHSICHDVLYPNHDREYRGISLFMSEFFERQGLKIRVFDILNSLCGETIIQVNTFGNTTDTNTPYLDVLAHAGHMRWLRPTGETMPSVERDWLIHLGDFVTNFPWQTIEHIVDQDRSEISHAPFLTCRQCHRKEKAPLAPTSFYRSTKLTNIWPKKLVVVGRRTGGYPTIDETTFGKINESFPIESKEWRGSTPIYPETHEYIEQTHQSFTLEGLVQVAKCGDQLIKTAGSLRGGLVVLSRNFSCNNKNSWSSISICTWKDSLN